MKKLFVLLLLTAALFVTPVFADTSDPTTGDPSTGDPTTGEEQQPYVITVSSADELSKVLSSEPGANGPVIVQFTEGTVVSDSIYVPYNVTLDLNGGTLNGYVDLEGDNSSIINGTINKGGISVRSNDSGGTISGVTIKNAPEMGIEINGGKIGDITDNTILSSKYHAIRLYNGVAGDITGNTLTDCRGDGISVYNGSHCGKISRNTLTNIGGADSKDNGDYGITINAHSTQKTYASEITYNKINGVTFAGIVVHSAPEGKTGSSYKDKGYVTGDIAYNTVNKAGTYTKNKECQAAIYIDNYATVNGAIHHNKISASQDDGISVIKHSHVKTIYSNTVKSVKHAGIAVKDNSYVSGDIKGNTVTSPKEHGIFVNNKSNAKGSIISNKVSKPGVNGIFVANSATANIIKKNTVTGAKLYGVIAGNKSKINKLQNNTISVNQAKKGMGVISNTGCVISNISGNKISGKYTVGIRIIAAKKKITVTKNTITAGNPSGVWSRGISANNSSKLVITKNKITGNKTGPGIYVPSCKGKFSGNKISKSTSKISRSAVGQRPNQPTTAAG